MAFPGDTSWLHGIAVVRSKLLGPRDNPCWDLSFAVVVALDHRRTAGEVEEASSWKRTTYLGCWEGILPKILEEAFDVAKEIGDGRSLVKEEEEGLKSPHHSCRMTLAVCVELEDLLYSWERKKCPLSFHFYLGHRPVQNSKRNLELV
jgi:hypothetical protein